MLTEGKLPSLSASLCKVQEAAVLTYQFGLQNIRRKKKIVWWFDIHYLASRAV